MLHDAMYKAQVARPCSLLVQLPLSYLSILNPTSKKYLKKDFKIHIVVTPCMPAVTLTHAMSKITIFNTAQKYTVTTKTTLD